MSFKIEDAPPDFLEGLTRDRERGERELQGIKGKLSDLDDRLDEIGRPSEKESLDTLMEEARRLGVDC